jgi:hypothetical protein
VKRKYLFKSRKNMQYLKSVRNTRWKVFILSMITPFDDIRVSGIRKGFILTKGISLSKKDQNKLLRKSVKESK